MKLYLAGGYGLQNVIGREREVSNMFPVWKRLYSYHFLHLIIKSEILEIKHENLPSISRTKKSTISRKNPS